MNDSDVEFDHFLIIERHFSKKNLIQNNWRFQKKEEIGFEIEV